MRWLRRSSTNWMQCWQTPVEGLHLIPAGIAKSAPTAALDSERMRTLLEVTQEHFDVVVLDTPPTRATSDAVVIGAETEAVTLVVSADESDSRALDAAMKALHQAGSRVAGVILNRFDDQKAGDYAFNYAYYGADDYDEYQLEAPAPQQARTEA
jgi:capsular exopolysaccharide synthesis family protein